VSNNVDRSITICSVKVLKSICIAKTVKGMVWETMTRNSAIADKLHDVFRDQSSSPNMIPFDMLGHISVLM